MKINISEESNQIIDEVLQDIISMLYATKAVPKSFIYDTGVRIVIRERMKDMMVNCAINELVRAKNVTEFLKLSVKDIDNIRSIMVGYLLAFYDLTKDR
jgi:hypothetical protein